MEVRWLRPNDLSTANSSRFDFFPSLLRTAHRLLIVDEIFSRNRGRL